MLSKLLKQTIENRGPITIASYMKQCLTNPEYGYYMQKNPFGAKGDFVTSPEISQMFGELVGINVIAQWIQQGKPSKFRLIEFGPGKGTLMDDLLRAAKSFPDFWAALDRIELVEASKKLGQTQQQTLAKYSKELKWFDVASELPQKDLPAFMIAHEFFDALPIQQYEKSEKGWQERLVAVKDDKLTPFLAADNQLVDKFIMSQKRYSCLNQLSQIEVSSDSWQVAKEMAIILKASSGGALVMDYGPLKTVPSNTFRGFKNHKQVDPFEEPGSADLTADVDFIALKEIFEFAGCIVDGPIRQDDWLHNMGIGARATVLHNAQTTPEGKQRIESAYKRLVDPLHMGKTYKVMAISSQGHNPAGFETLKSS